MSSTPPVFYFAYGSNLSLTQMRNRCPDALPIAIAHLAHPWAWLINERGYANVVDTSKHDAAADQTAAADATLDAASSMGSPDKPGVYGLLYLLSSDDEADLDMYEGVPLAYEKVHLPVTVDSAVVDKGFLIKSNPVNALVYVDYQRTASDKPLEEYVERMNRGIREAMPYRLPEWYVERVMRPFIPEGREDASREDGEEEDVGDSVGLSTSHGRMVLD